MVNQTSESNVERKVMKLRSLINIKESPDHAINADGEMVRFTDSDAVAFGYNRQNEFVMGKGEAHFQLPTVRSRTHLKFPGRLWLDSRVISFWGKYPTRKELEQIINDIHEYSYNEEVSKGLTGADLDELDGISINSEDWLVEVPKQETVDKMDWDEKNRPDLIPLKDYQATSAEHEPTQHVVSPLKKKQQEVPAGLGSKKNVAGLTQTQYHQLKSTTDEGKKMDIRILKENFDAYLKNEHHEEFDESILEMSVKELLDQLETKNVPLYKALEEYLAPEKEEAPEEKPEETPEEAPETEMSAGEEEKV